MTTQQEACKEYIIKLLKSHDDISPQELNIARESFNEGWSQAELEFKIQERTRYNQIELMKSLRS